MYHPATITSLHIYSPQLKPAFYLILKSIYKYGVEAEGQLFWLHKMNMMNKKLHKMGSAIFFHLDYNKYWILVVADVEDQICPVLMQLTAGDSSDDYRSEAVTVWYYTMYLIWKTVLFLYVTIVCSLWF